ncbi:MAG TPA: hypothetical protein VID47_04585 [Actinomycetota bacterium]
MSSTLRSGGASWSKIVDQIEIEPSRRTASSTIRDCDVRSMRPAVPTSQNPRVSFAGSGRG